jgi:hypothetical protein
MRLDTLLLSAVLGLGLIAPGAAWTAETAAPANQAATAVVLPPILAPMVVDGRLQGYAHLTLSIQPRGMDKVLMVREKVPFLQDAFLRELNQSSIVKADDHAAVDTEAMTTRLMARLNHILPAGTVASLKVENVVLVPVKQE